MKRIYFLFAIIAIVVLTAQAFSDADAEADAFADPEAFKLPTWITDLFTKDNMKKMCPMAKAAMEKACK
uniref:Venom peptide ECTX1-Rm6h n=1 Tax=Rhytidoponera metallica TaxID=148364 RepID=A0A8U0LTZ8_RHYMT|nr:venom peptide precursor ECTX1-Rm6h [Rhytidoponera metallica]